MKKDGETTKLIEKESEALQYPLKEDLDSALDVDLSNTERVVVAEQKSEEKAGMPQMDVSSFSSQIFWLVVTFSVLYLLMSKSVLPRIHEILEKRRHRLEHDLSQAEELSKRAEQARKEYETLHNQSQLEASRLIADIHRELKSVADNQSKELDAELANKMTKAQLRIAESVANIRSQLEPVAMSVAEDIVVKIVGDKLKDKKIIEEAVKGANW